MKSIPVLLELLLVTWLLFVVGCKDAVITPPQEDYQFDSARYQWTIHVLNQDLITFQAFDTSNIYFLDLTNLVFYNGKIFESHFFGSDGFRAISMFGFDKSNIYLGGSDNTIANNGKPRLKKWDGSTFLEIPITDSTNRQYQICCVKGFSTDQILLGSTRGDLIFYDNDNLQFFRVDSSFAIMDFGEDEVGNWYAISVKTVFDTSSTMNYLDIYKKDNLLWKWEKVFSRTYHSFDLTEIIPTKIKNRIFGFQNNNILKFTGNNFVNFFEIEPFNISPLRELSDSSVNFFTQPGFIDNSGLKLFNWNGTKWSLELSFVEMGIYADIFTKISKINENYFFIYSDLSFGRTYFGKGVKKNPSPGT